MPAGPHQAELKVHPGLHQQPKVQSTYLSRRIPALVDHLRALREGARKGPLFCLSDEASHGSTAQGFFSLTKREYTDPRDPYGDLDATIAEYAEQDTAYKARVKETERRREEEECSSR